MGVITKISVQQKRTDRYNIFLDEQYAFSVDEAVLIQFNLKKGMEITDQLKAEIAARDDIHKGINTAIHFLSIRMRSEKEVRDHLTKKEIDEAAIDEVIQSLYQMSYLNDREFAKAYVNTQINTTDKGPSVVERELKERGIKGSIIQEVMAKFDHGIQLEKVLSLAEKYKRKYSKDSARMQKQKTEQALMRKGYGWEVIQEAITESVSEEGEQDEALMYQAEKAHRRYSKLPSGEYDYKMKQALYRKGFMIHDIERVISQLKGESSSFDNDF